MTGRTEAASARTRAHASQATTVHAAPSTYLSPTRRQIFSREVPELDLLDRTRQVTHDWTRRWVRSPLPRSTACIGVHHPWPDAVHHMVKDSRAGTSIVDWCISVKKTQRGKALRKIVLGTVIVLKSFFELCILRIVWRIYKFYERKINDSYKLLNRKCPEETQRDTKNLVIEKKVAIIPFSEESRNPLS
jgi:hypothetical protein